MNTTTRTLVLAAPIAAVALSLGTGAASAADHGPVDKGISVKPTHPGPQGPGEITDVDHSEPTDHPKDRPSSSGHGSGVQLPKRIDAGFAGTASDGLELSWLAAGGLLVTVAGAAAARARHA